MLEPRPGAGVWPHKQPATKDILAFQRRGRPCCAGVRGPRGAGGSGEGRAAAGGGEAKEGGGREESSRGCGGAAVGRGQEGSAAGGVWVRGPPCLSVMSCCYMVKFFYPSGCVAGEGAPGPREGRGAAQGGGSRDQRDDSGEGQGRHRHTLMREVRQSRGVGKKSTDFLLLPGRTLQVPGASAPADGEGKQKPAAKPKARQDPSLRATEGAERWMGECAECLKAAEEAAQVGRVAERGVGHCVARVVSCRPPISDPPARSRSSHQRSQRSRRSGES